MRKSLLAIWQPPAAVRVCLMTPRMTIQFASNHEKNTAGKRVCRAGRLEWSQVELVLCLGNLIPSEKSMPSRLRCDRFKVKTVAVLFASCEIMSMIECK